MASTSETTPRAIARRISKPVTGILVERVLRRGMAAFCLVFGAQAVPLVLGQHVLPPLWKLPILVVMYGGFAGIAVLGALGRPFVVLARFVCVAYLVALLLWSTAAAEPTLTRPNAPWLAYVSNIAMAAAIFGFAAWIAAMYTVVVPALYFVVRQSPPGGSALPRQALFESLDMFILGIAALILVLLLQRSARAVDESQAAAVHRYSGAVREHAVEKQRIEVDAIVHDGVLTTFLSAARATTPAAQTLAASMAQLSMTRLAEATRTKSVEDAPVTLAVTQERLAAELQRLDPQAVITPKAEIPAMLLPADVAETLFAAASQALVNSRQHAGDTATRHVRIRVVERVAEIAIIDDGAGFDTSLPSERIGLRVSILERVANAGGDAHVRSRVGGGTTVTLRWTSESRHGRAQRS